MQPNSKIIGSFVIGFALVAGTYLMTNFGKPVGQYSEPPQITASQQAAPIRSAIAVSDEDGNGIEDWRDEFVQTEPIILDASVRERYEAPQTLTGKMGLNFIQDVLTARQYDGLGRTQDQIINDTVSSVINETSQAIFDTPDIKMIRNWNEQSVRTYSNAVALAILENNKTDLENEILILQDIVNRNDTSRIAELETLAELYRLTRDAIIEIPVPEVFAKQHLDLINSLHAVHHDVLGMTLAYEDPVYALMRLKRYENDVLGMVKSLENLYLAFEPYASIYEAADPAFFFVQFNPTNNIRI